METIHMGSGIAGCGHMNQAGVAYDRFSGLILAARFQTARFQTVQNKRDIISNGLSQTGGSNSDQLRCLLLGHILQAKLQVCRAAVNRMFFTKR